ncbi:MAG: hypothetical protein AAB353_09815 [Candidatus Hydrogenedentota bacterium]
MGRLLTKRRRAEFVITTHGTPSDETLAHVIDEYIDLEQLTRAAEGYTAILEALLG